MKCPNVIGREAGCGWWRRVVWKFGRACTAPPQSGGIGWRRMKTLALVRTECPHVLVIVFVVVVVVVVEYPSIENNYC